MLIKLVQLINACAAIILVSGLRVTFVTVPLNPTAIPSAYTTLLFGVLFHIPVL
jgi:hypothetical protein